MIFITTLTPPSLPCTSLSLFPFFSLYPLSSFLIPPSPLPPPFLLPSSLPSPSLPPSLPSSPYRPGVILGVTNLFFVKALQHWPHVVKVNHEGAVYLLFIHSIMYPSLHPSIHPSIHSFFIHSFIHSFAHYSIHSFVH